MTDPWRDACYRERAAAPYPPGKIWAKVESLF
jgi:hypothetical protein